MSYPAPIFSWTPMRAKSLHPKLAFTRASTARVNPSTGVLAAAGNNVIRLDHDPATGLERGFLVEESRTNLLTYSQDFTAWGNASATITSNVAVAPDGAATADKLVEAASSGEHYVYPAQPSLTSGTTYTGSFYAKAGERNKLRLQGTASTFGVYANINADFDLTDGIVLRTGASASAAIQSIGGGWYRCSLTLVATATANGAIVPILLNGAANEYTGDGTSGLFIWGAQLEAGSVPTSYIPTTTAQVTRSADVCSLALADLVGPHGEPLWNGAEGTLLVDVIHNYSEAYSNYVTLDDGNTNNRLVLGVNGGTSYVYASSGGVAQINLQGLNAETNGGRIRTAVAFKLNDYAYYRNGVQKYTTSSALVPAVTRLVLAGATGSYTFRQVLLFNRRLSNAQLQALTA